MSEFSEWLNEPVGGALVTNGSTKPRVNGKATRRKSQATHNYRLIESHELRGIPATNAQQADDPRKRHKLAAIRKPRTHAIALTDTLVTRADGSQYWIPRNTRTTSRRVTKERTAAIVRHHMTAADMAPIQNYNDDV